LTGAAALAGVARGVALLSGISAESPRPLFEAALLAGAQVRELRETAPSLEDAFRKVFEDGGDA